MAPRNDNVGQRVQETMRDSRFLSVDTNGARKTRVAWPATAGQLLGMTAERKPIVLRVKASEVTTGRVVAQGRKASRQPGTDPRVPATAGEL